ncbi:hypothetical protein AX768_03660 [Burkholderia sp. PAMC 28687]|uniref:hypothetical protein n=1 Tax=Burkholderia sp. PAMC 28687 TaxID=1795874 RepID=UPI000781C9AB|nr:hypothetical protein [Burkholderia sp. PAMC 28687]AMM13340.1 hypothetical protein AX768_03660 [Burkholderia sp. PAMC 28687]
MMSAPKLRDQLHAKRVEIAKLHEDVARCDSSAATGDVHRQAVADLKKQRETIVAQAFLDSTNPDTKKLDKQIADAEQAHRAAIDTGVAAANAKVILARKIEVATSELEEIELENTSQAVKECGEAYARAIDEYEKALAAYISAIAGIHAAAATSSNFGTATSTYQMNAYDALVRMIGQHGIVSAPPNFHPSPILDRGPDWSMTEPHVLRIAQRLEDRGIELPQRLAELVEKEVA